MNKKTLKVTPKAKPTLKLEQKKRKKVIRTKYV
jgi:hypothetical protein